jgi:asparagine synthase (glutamine-hydrolysing)
MCGIAGFVGAGEFQDLERMVGRLFHRGPDNQGLWSDPEHRVFLGHRRLSILDLSGGSQPMWTADGLLGIVFNGEIYNFRELRTELAAAGHVFLTHHSDTEVLLHAYREWGEDLTGRLNGMWAFAIYDRGRQRLFCSRDRFGKKPFYYTWQNGVFAFASEITALQAHSALRFNVSRQALKKYFGYSYIPAPLSLYREVQKLPAGHSLVYELGTREPRVSGYWEFVLEPEESRPSGYEERCAEEVRALLDKAVQRRLVSDVPIGVFLSGGMDSSAIAALADRHVPAGTLKTFSVGFQEASFDESPYARRVAGLVGSDHYEETLSLERALDLLPDIVGRLDEPLGDSSLLPTYLLCQFARQRVTVALGGDGGDELFAGYAPFKALRWAGFYEKLVPRPVHKAILFAMAKLPVSHGYMSLDFKIKRTLRGLSYPKHLWNPVWMSSLDEREFSELFQEPIVLEELFSEAIALWDRCKGVDEVDRTLQFFTRLYLQDDILMKVDRASMMNSLEVRAPFLDIELVDRVRRIPSHLKLRSGASKYILKKALEPILPRDILYRPKQGFAVPVGQWFRDGRIATESRTQRSSWNAAFVRRKLAEHRYSRADQRMFLWNQWVLEATNAAFAGIDSGGHGNRLG